MAQDRSWSGWIGFAAILLLVVGMIDIFQGLIAIIRGQYYALAAGQIIIFDLKTWGWITLFWGIVAVLAALGLASGAGWARWFAIIVAILSIIDQLGFLGSSPYPIWALTVLTLTIIVLFALIVRWGELQGSGARLAGPLRLNAGCRRPLRDAADDTRCDLGERRAEERSGEHIAGIVDTRMDTRVGDDGRERPDRDRVAREDRADAGGEGEGRRRVARGKRPAGGHRGPTRIGYVGGIRTPAPAERLQHEVGNGRCGADRGKPGDRGAPPRAPRVAARIAAQPSHSRE